MAVISIVAIIIFWQVYYDLLVSVVKLGRNGFNIALTSFPTYKNGTSPGRFFKTKGDGAC